ncbi:MAG: hypothetical protein Q6363_004845 [Candidatus Njordarchaeota archaeon]
MALLGFPEKILRMLGLVDGSEVVIAVSSDRIIIRLHRRGVSRYRWSHRMA